jgi:hypothetical protein
MFPKIGLIFLWGPALVVIYLSILFMLLLRPAQKANISCSCVYPRPMVRGQFSMTYASAWQDKKRWPQLDKKLLFVVTKWKLLTVLSLSFLVNLKASSVPLRLFQKFPDMCACMYVYVCVHVLPCLLGCILVCFCVTKRSTLTQTL